MQGQAAGGTGGKASPFQNPAVLIGIIAVAVIAIIVVIIMLLPKGSSSTSSATPLPTVPATGVGTDTTTGSGAMTGDLPAGTGMGALGSGMSTGATGAAPAPAAGASPAGAPAAGNATETATRQPPGVSVRKNAFLPNTELRHILANIPEATTTVLSPDQALWQELQAEKPPKRDVSLAGEDEPGPPIPPMRVAAIVQGAQVSALIQIGSEYSQAVPGRMVPESSQIYRVERIETDRVFLTRKWRLGTRQGTQKIEVPLSEAARAAGPQPGGAFPQPGGGGAPSGGAAQSSS